jgi:hypothetical protein
MLSLLEQHPGELTITALKGAEKLVQGLARDLEKRPCVLRARVNATDADGWRDMGAPYRHGDKILCVSEPLLSISTYPESTRLNTRALVCACVCACVRGIFTCSACFSPQSCCRFFQIFIFILACDFACVRGAIFRIPISWGEA